MHDGGATGGQTAGCRWCKAGKQGATLPRVREPEQQSSPGRMLASTGLTCCLFHDRTTQQHSACHPEPLEGSQHAQTHLRCSLAAAEPGREAARSANTVWRRVDSDSEALLLTCCMWPAGAGVGRAGRR